jgi:hypothetical protein
MLCTVQVYPRLSERLGVKDHVMVLNIMLQKIATNLKAFASCEDVVSHTLNLFQASGHNASQDSQSIGLQQCPDAIMWQYQGSSCRRFVMLPLHDARRIVFHAARSRSPSTATLIRPPVPANPPCAGMPAGPGQRLHERQAAAEAGGSQLPAAAPPRRALCLPGRAWQHAAPVSASALCCRVANLHRTGVCACCGLVHASVNVHDARLQPSMSTCHSFRPVFYSTLARLLFMEDTPAKFHSFVAPLQQVRVCDSAFAMPGSLSIACKSSLYGNAVIPHTVVQAQLIAAA